MSFIICQNHIMMVINIMKGSKLTKPRTYFSREKHNPVFTDEPLLTEPVQDTMMFKGKIAHKKKPYRIHVQQKTLNKNAEFALLPTTTKQQQINFVNNFIKAQSKTEIKLCTYEILRHLQVKCSEQIFSTQTNFHLFKTKEMEWGSKVDSRKTAATPEVVSRLMSRAKGSVNLFDSGGTLAEQETTKGREIVFPFSISKSQSKIRSSSVKKTSLTPTTTNRSKPLTKLKSFRSSDQKKINNINLNKPLLNYNFTELKHIKSESFAMIEADSEQLVLVNRGKVSLEIASITKIMTAYVILTMVEKRNIDIRETKVEVEGYVEKTTGTSAELIEGDIYSVLELLYGLLLPSGNDAALVLADWGGSILNQQQGKQSQYKQNVNTFVQKMTKTAKDLGLTETRYGNPHGLPHPEGKSTALEQCCLAAQCLKNKTFKQIVQTQHYKFHITNTQNQKRLIVWQNTNKLLRRQGFIGLKTGITVTAGPCLVSAYEFKQKIYILTVLRASKVSRRFKDSRKILHWALSKLYEGKTYFEESLKLEELKKNKKQLDSDYSEDEKQFVYGEENEKELSRRKNILINQL